MLQKGWEEEFTTSYRTHRILFLGVENGVPPTASPLDRKDALTRKPLDFDQEEETRKVETSKWLEHHFGSDSRSSNNSLIDEEEQPPKTNFFKVTIKSQPARTDHIQNSSYLSTVNNSSSRLYSPVEPEKDRNRASDYYKGGLNSVYAPNSTLKFGVLNWQFAWHSLSIALKLFYILFLSVQSTYIYFDCSLNNISSLLLLLFLLITSLNII